MIDATTLAVLQGKLASVTDEMDVLLVRGAFSPIISEALDRASGVYHPETGEIIVQGETGLPIFAVTMQFAVLAVIDRCRELGVAPGDVFILNDTQRTGTHLHDVKLVKPIFHEGRLICFVANVAHWLDIGGAVPAGYNPKATDMIQEGLVIPPAKVYEAGTLNRSVFDLIIANTRLPEQNTADFFTMAGCLDAGGRRIGELIERYGADGFGEALDELVRRSEQQMRSHIREIPDGRYEASAHIDNDGVTDAPLTIRLAAVVEGDSMTLDFTGTSDACNGPFNIASPTTMAACFIALKHVFPDVPLNAGCFKPLEFVLPEASLVNSPRGKSQEFYLEAALNIAAALLNAMGQAVPHLASGGPFTTLPFALFGGRNPDTGKYQAGIVALLGGGYGGSSDADGLINGAISVGAARMPSLEVMEQRFPVRYHRYAIREDSAGAGEHPGGHGTEIDLEFTWPAGAASVTMDSLRHGPDGVGEGLPGRSAESELHVGNEVRPPTLGKEVGVPFEAGDRVVIRSPGGGGYGAPFDRDPGLVARDVARGYISGTTALDTYGVVLNDDGTPDIEGTALRRLSGR